MVLGPPWGVVYHLKDGLLDLGALLEGGGEGAHGRAGDEGADDAAVALQLQTNHLREEKVSGIIDKLVECTSYNTGRPFSLFKTSC